MQRKGPQKHAVAKIVSAIMQHEAGTAISEIARLQGVNKSLVKYWIDHAEKYLPEPTESKRAPAISKLLKRGELIGWRKLVQLISLDKKTMDAMSGRERIEAAETLKNILMGLGARNGPVGGMPGEIIELTEKKASLIVREWKRKNDEKGLAASLVEPVVEAVAAARPPDAAAAQPEGNSAP